MSIKIDLSDVVAAGSVESAILAFAENSDEYASGTIGSSFSTSGPGAGWSKTHDSSDFAERALDDEYGALYYVDSEDGRVASKDADGDITWSDESEIELVCPEIEDAIESPKEAAEMAQAVIDTHGAESDKDDWRKLVKAIKEAAEAFDDIDEGDLE